MHILKFNSVGLCSNLRHEKLKLIRSRSPVPLTHKSMSNDKKVKICKHVLRKNCNKKRAPAVSDRRLCQSNFQTSLFFLSFFHSISFPFFPSNCVNVDGKVCAFFLGNFAVLSQFNFNHFPPGFSQSNMGSREGKRYMYITILYH